MQRQLDNLFSPPEGGSTVGASSNSTIKLSGPIPLTLPVVPEIACNLSVDERQRYLRRWPSIPQPGTQVWIRYAGTVCHGQVVHCMPELNMFSIRPADCGSTRLVTRGIEDILPSTPHQSFMSPPAEDEWDDDVLNCDISPGCESKPHFSITSDQVRQDESFPSPLFIDLPSRISADETQPCLAISSLSELLSNSAPSFSLSPTLNVSDFNNVNCSRSGIEMLVTNHLATKDVSLGILSPIPFTATVSTRKLPYFQSASTPRVLSQVNVPGFGTFTSDIALSPDNIEVDKKFVHQVLPIDLKNSGLSFTGCENDHSRAQPTAQQTNTSNYSAMETVLQWINSFSTFTVDKPIFNCDQHVRNLSDNAVLEDGVNNHFSSDCCSVNNLSTDVSRFTLKPTELYAVSCSTTHHALSVPTKNSISGIQVSEIQFDPPVLMDRVISQKPRNGRIFRSRRFTFPGNDVPHDGKTFFGNTYDKSALNKNSECFVIPISVPSPETTVSQVIDTGQPLPSHLIDPTKEARSRLLSFLDRLVSGEVASSELCDEFQCNVLGAGIDNILSSLLNERESLSFQVLSSILTISQLKFPQTDQKSIILNQLLGALCKALLPLTQASSPSINVNLPSPVRIADSMDQGQMTFSQYPDATDVEVKPHPCSMCPLFAHPPSCFQLKDELAMPVSSSQQDWQQDYPSAIYCRQLYDGDPLSLETSIGLDFHINLSNSDSLKTETSSTQISEAQSFLAKNDTGHLDVMPPEPSTSNFSYRPSALRARKFNNKEHSSIGSPTFGVGRSDIRKCRKVYGIEHRDQWCNQCKWKKACRRFPNPGAQLAAGMRQSAINVGLQNRDWNCSINTQSAQANTCATQRLTPMSERNSAQSCSTSTTSLSE